MNIIVHSDINDFLNIIEPSLRRNEAANNLMLGVAKHVQIDPFVYGDSYFCATIYENDKLTAAALMTPPYNLLIYCECDNCDSAWPVLIRELIQTKQSFPAVMGQNKHVNAFADAWIQLSGEDRKRSEKMRAFEFREVTWPEIPSGFMQQAKVDNLAQVANWENAFSREALGKDNPLISLDQIQKQIEDGEVFLWIDGEPVSMAATTRPVGKGISISWVYTPPDKRWHGYAGALVATLSQHMLKKGYEYCTLFTDLANPISNSIYQKIGYKPICDYETIFFEKNNNQEEY